MPLRAPQDLNLTPENVDLVLDALYRTNEAAKLMRLSPSTVSKWTSRTRDGKPLLQPAAYDDAGRPLYRLRDLARAEMLTRTRARREYVA